MGVITRPNSALLIIDFQTSLAPVMVGLDEVTNPRVHRSPEYPLSDDRDVVVEHVDPNQND